MLSLPNQYQLLDFDGYAVSVDGDTVPSLQCDSIGCLRQIMRPPSGSGQRYSRDRPELLSTIGVVMNPHSLFMIDARRSADVSSNMNRADDFTPSLVGLFYLFDSRIVNIKKLFLRRSRAHGPEYQRAPFVRLPPRGLRSSGTRSNNTFHASL